MHPPDRSALALLAFPSRPEDRLRLALRRLEAALAAQGDAFAEWRAALAALDGAVTGLHEGALRYQASLAATAADLDRARAAAQALDATAEAMRALAEGGARG
ncbi:hypothetical protein GCM10010964_16470 [Caldovatus sediminis]|uniref:Uncharacterized protein n=1 Tax=Caldovatus sediminis TaxID=2041189 RepID=A0A8J2ZAM4_9PROT|nr:hypothetical protein [Caldovatus sediminis]GGG29327.1 hypothetical protein GCM10010964_16470 [Caldovatus sediminis]